MDDLVRARNGATTSELQMQLEQEGYLYFPSVVSKDTIDVARTEVIDVLRDLGCVGPERDRPVWTGQDLSEIGLHPAPLHSSGIWQRLSKTPSMTQLYERVFGEPALVFPICQYQFTWPTMPDRRKTVHQDIFYNKGFHFLTFWVALMDIPPELGGLAIAPGSHRTLLPHSNFFFGGRYVDLPTELPESRWARSWYCAGDVVVFSGMTAHSGLPNSTGLLRLSIDLRPQAYSAPHPVIGVVVGAGENSVDIRVRDARTTTVQFDENTNARDFMGRQMKPAQFVERQVIASVGGDIALTLRLAS